MLAPSPAANHGPVVLSDRAAERALRQEVRDEVDRRLAERQLLAPAREDEDEIRAIIRNRLENYNRLQAARNRPLLVDALAVEQRLLDELLGMGILQSYMNDQAIEEIIVNSPNRVFLIEGGRKRLADVCFDSDADVRQLVKRLIGPLGRRLDESSPMVDARLTDGSRLNAAIPPATTNWTAITIRKFLLKADSLDQLVAFGTISQSAAEFLDCAVRAGVNILVSGPTGAGKTTLLNCLGSCISALDERIVTVEEVAELQLERHLPDCVALQARAGNVEGLGEIRIRDLVRNALRMRPTRIVVGEVRGAEALDMLLALNTGHEGSLTTIHGNSPRDALARLATLAMMAEERLSGDALNRMVARTVELVVQLRFDVRTNQRRVVTIFEVTGLDGDTISGNDLWTFDGDSQRLVATGIQPRCLAKFRDRDITYSPPPAGIESGMSPVSPR